MPIDISRLEARIILYRWKGRVAVNELREATAQAAQLAGEQGELPYIAINDLTNSSRIPMDVRGFTRIVNSVTEDVLFVVIINPPPLTDAIIHTFQAFAPVLKKLRTFNNRDEAIGFARGVLKISNQPEDNS